MDIDFLKKNVAHMKACSTLGFLVKTYGTNTMIGKISVLMFTKHSYLLVFQMSSYKLTNFIK